MTNDVIHGYNSTAPHDAVLPPRGTQGHRIEDSKKIGPEMQEKVLGFSWALG